MAADPLDKAAFEAFAVRCKADLRRIARRTRQEHDFEDVKHEALLMAWELSSTKGIALDFRDESFQQLLLRHLYQHLVRYTEQHVRHAVRLDRAAGGEDREVEPHPLMRNLASDDGQHPLTILLDWEETSTQPVEPPLPHSLAGAYVLLLRHFDNRMRAVADHLLISLSYAYRRCAHARLLAACQQHMPLQMMEDSFFPGPWRRFRLQRTPQQLNLDFGEELPFGAMAPHAADG